jgi:hypothetical protein
LVPRGERKVKAEYQSSWVNLLKKWFDI